ncbi:MAG TPA: 16S rRNA (adenine(1518)-N(6)/adenine(1519)-N(6))-dimethyltransferase RsmA [Chitinophagaceae bacterium]|nr:16S rRNA (adenine(1518)-N(6)/adenine(1519)-N(6))-dimethyltransferase RsmA [Chitinophagaceae bacterium]
MIRKAFPSIVEGFFLKHTPGKYSYFASMITLKKSLGQHFLKDENICRKIVASLQQHSFSQLLEVGPGGGALTKYLLGIKNIDFKAVELDGEKVDYLLRTYPELKGKIIHKSFLGIEKPFNGKFTVVGNFPYNISTQILFKILEWKDDVECMLGMFQKEVAQRIAAKEGSKVYGVTSVLVQAFFSVEYLFDVNPSSFQPPPKVKSGVLRLLPQPKMPVMKSEKDFFVLVKTAFNQRRKTLRNAVKDLFDAAILKDELFNKRAEQLTVKEFAELTFQMNLNSPLRRR